MPSEPFLPTPPRPLTFREVTTGALEMYRRHFRAMFGTSLLASAIVAPAPLALVVVSARHPEPQGAAYAAAAIALLVLLLPVWVLSWGALARQGWNACTGGEVSVRDGVRGAWRALPRLVAVYLVFVPLYGLGYVLLIVPALVVGTVLFAKVHAVIVEDRSAFGALRRSAGLARGRFGGIFVVQALAVGLARLCDTSVEGLEALARGGGPALLGLHPTAAPAWWGPALLGAGQLAAITLTTPLVTAAVTLLYYDARVRTEMPAAPATSAGPARAAG